MTYDMKVRIAFMLLLMPGFLQGQKERMTVTETDNSIFRQHPYWRGGDGAATVQLGSGRILWLFSDTFIDQDGTGRRSNSRSMIRKSFAIQDSTLLGSELKYYCNGTWERPEDFFILPGKNWFWTGHGISTMDKLVIFLFEVTPANSGTGFEVVGWHVAVIDNPNEVPGKWTMNYNKGPETRGIIVGSSAVLQDEDHVYAFGDKEPATHETYLCRFNKSELINGDLANMEWWSENAWTGSVNENPGSSCLFVGQTEFSVHHEKSLGKYIQIKAFGFGNASIGYRLADHLYGPWSEPVMFYSPSLAEEKEFVYSANAHPNTGLMNFLSPTMSTAGILQDC